mmetsp:Transcript_33435/g.72346  ORF Transcript_33435/g.72346 Transcript_33435/m.72346 type:complete len:202 (-) Transcript_33435:952-1557(-)
MPSAFPGSYRLPPETVDEKSKFTIRRLRPWRPRSLAWAQNSPWAETWAPAVAAETFAAVAAASTSDRRPHHHHHPCHHPLPFPWVAQPQEDAEEEAESAPRTARPCQAERSEGRRPSREGRREEWQSLAVGPTERWGVAAPVSSSLAADEDENEDAVEDPTGDLRDILPSEEEAEVAAADVAAADGVGRRGLTILSKGCLG